MRLTVVIRQKGVRLRLEAEEGGMKRMGRIFCWVILVLGISGALYAGVAGLAAQYQRGAEGNPGQGQELQLLCPEDCRVMEFLLRREGHGVRVAGGRLVLQGREIFAELDCRYQGSTGGDARAINQFAFTWLYPLVDQRPVLEEGDD
jgi:hypothetical protein